MMRNQRRVLYHPAHVKRFAAAALRHARELQALIEDVRLERDQIREERRALRVEMDLAWAAFRRLQAIDTAQRAERDAVAVPFLH
jgi:hypothetical protein